MCTIFGVCTSLGLGVRQINVGLLRLDNRLVEAALFPFLPIKRILTFTMAPAAACYATLGFVTFYFAVTLLAMCPIEANLRFIAAAWYMAFSAIVAYTRYRVRRHR